MTSGRVAITVDLEFFDSAFLWRGGRGTPPPGVNEIGVKGVEFISELLEEHRTRATFFTLGEVAEEHPDLVAELAERGHEIASHGYSKSHPDLREASETFVHNELSKSKKILESITGKRVNGFRAPAFSLDDSVLEAAADIGHTYDSSIVPGRRIPGFYGTPEAPGEPFQTEEMFSTRGVIEFPIATAPVIRLPISGAWMRLLGRQYALWGVQNHLANHPITVIYVHPWELVNVPRYDSIPRRVTWRTGRHARETLIRIVEENAPRIEPIRNVHEEFIGGQLP